jgi:hypothetical protein
LPEVVEVIDLACTEVLRKNHAKVVVYWKGVFFDALKETPGVLPTQAYR